MTRSFASATRWLPHGMPLPPVRLVTIVAASIALHWLLLAWSGFKVGAMLPTLRNEDPITVALRQAPRVQPPTTAPAVTPTKPNSAKEAKAKEQRQTRPQPLPESALPPSQPSMTTVTSQPALMAAGAASDMPVIPMSPSLTDPLRDAPVNDDSVSPEMRSLLETAADTPLAEAPVAAVQIPEQAPSSRSYRIAAPPPADLKYDVQALRDGQNVYGSGRIVWQPAGNAYRIQGEAGVLFFRVLEFHSEGVIDENGVAPVLYSEKRFRKPLSTTHFQRTEGLIRFSASALTYPHQGGEQDRASIVWQLAGIGRGDPEAFRPDAGITVFVAGARNGEAWHVRVVGEEEIDLDTGSMRAWHVVREPRAGSYDQKLEIWFAPEQEWYPVRLRYTERNGDWLEMSLSAIRDVASR